jgi:hypothetical protein
MRLIHRPALELILDELEVGGSHFGPEMMLQVIHHKLSVIEIPLNYRQRVGESSVTGSRWRAFTLGLEMIRLIITFRVRTWFSPRRPVPAEEYVRRGIRPRGYPLKQAGSTPTAIDAGRIPQP